MKKTATILTTILAGATLLTGCTTTTSSGVPAACIEAFDAAETIFTANTDVALATADLLTEIAPAMEAAIGWDANGMEPLLREIENVTAVTSEATETVNSSNYPALRDKCLNGE